MLSPQPPLRPVTDDVPVQVLDTLPESGCLRNTRGDWSPGESTDSAAAYREALARSTLTLSPAGQNTECYRCASQLRSRHPRSPTPRWRVRGPGSRQYSCD